MSRGWFLALALSVGLNAGLLWVQLTGRGLPAGVPGPPFVGRRGPPPALVMHDPERLVAFHLERMSAQLDLSQEQRTAIGDVLRERVPRLVELRERLVDVRRSVAEEYRSRPLDGSRFRAVVRTLRGTQADLDSLTAEVMLKEAELLTPEQREQYADVMPWGLDRPGPGGRPGDAGPPGGPPGRRGPGRPGPRKGI